MKATKVTIHRTAINAFLVMFGNVCWVGLPRVEGVEGFREWRVLVALRLPQKAHSHYSGAN